MELGWERRRRGRRTGWRRILKAVNAVISVSVQHGGSAREKAAFDPVFFFFFASFAFLRVLEVRNRMNGVEKSDAH
jgi:hypothetical protein